MSLRSLKHGHWLVLFLTVCLKTSYSQDPSPSFVISPSPSSASLARYSEIPVDLSTGVPGISIPLHVIESQQLSYPISMSYHASGIKVNDVAGPLGTGWTLNAGGEINRIMRNWPDEKAGGYFSVASSVPNETDPMTLPLPDMMPDLFYYNTGTMGGTMIFDNQLVPRTIPRNPLKIITNTATLASFTFADPGGKNFEFEAGETATATIAGQQISYIASWYLSRIVSADKQDTIRFNYSLNSSYTFTTSQNIAATIFYNIPVGASSIANQIYASENQVDVTVAGTRYLTSIEHKGGKVTFGFVGGRTDDINGKKLSQIIVYDKDPVTAAYTENKRIIFTYSYFQNNDTGTRLKLESFREQLNATLNPPYTFTYSTKRLPAPGSTAQDFWGYYNGVETNTSLIPAYTLGTFVVSTNDRTVKSNFVDGCVLRSIISPTGGETEFIFGSNKYYSGTIDVDGPGLRVNKIITRDPLSNISASTNYDYTNPSTTKSSGLLMNNPNFFTNLYVYDNFHGNGYNYNCLLIKMNPTGIGNFSGAPVVYEYVTTYTNNDVNTTGKTISKFSVYTAPSISYPYFPVTDNSWQAGNLLEQEIYKVQTSVSTIVKKIVNTYMDSPYSFTIKGLSAAPSKIFLFATPGNNDWTKKNYYAYSKFKYLSESKIYDYEQNSGTLNALTTRTNYFDKTDVHLFPTKVETTTSVSTDKIKQEYTYVVDGSSTGVNGVMKNLNMTGLPIDVTTSLSKNGTDYVTNYSKTEYFEWKPNKVYPKNFYEPKIPLNLTKASFQSAPSTYTRLNSRINAYNKSGIPLEREVIGNPAQSIVFDKEFNRIVAEANTSKSNQIAYSSFESRDYGNWKLTTGTTTSTKSLALSLSGTFKTFQIQTSQTINYTYSVTRTAGPNPMLTFSSGGQFIDKILSSTSGSGSVSLTPGTWNVSLTYDLNVTDVSVSFSYQQTSPNAPSIVTTQYKTGNRSLQLGTSQTILRDSLPSGTYTIMYYQKGGSVTVTPTGGATVVKTVTGTAESDGWTKIQKDITIGALSQSIQITGTTAMYIDELRLYPLGAFMTTTCFDVFKNIITKTDVNVRSQFIEYDVLRRTKVIRDHEKNILQHYDYKLAIN